MKTLLKGCILSTCLISSTVALEPIDVTEFEPAAPIYQPQTELDELIERIITKPLAWTPQEKLCLAKNIFHEAADEPLEGQVAVAVVTLNRALNSDFPSTICEVVYQRHTLTKTKTTRPKRTRKINYTVCQFTWTCLQVKPPQPHDTRWKNIVETVEHFSEGGFQNWKQKYKHSYNYHAYYVNPRWNLPFFTRTGAHLFYKR
jgi:spore germination cell wall hydrolase CwlJ-like protein